MAYHLGPALVLERSLISHLLIANKPITTILVENIQILRDPHESLLLTYKVNGREFNYAARHGFGIEH